MPRRIGKITLYTPDEWADARRRSIVALSPVLRRAEELLAKEIPGLYRTRERDILREPEFMAVPYIEVVRDERGREQRRRYVAVLPMGDREAIERYVMEQAKHGYGELAAGEVDAVLREYGSRWARVRGIAKVLGQGAISDAAVATGLWLLGGILGAIAPATGGASAAGSAVALAEGASRLAKLGRLGMRIAEVIRAGRQMRQIAAALPHIARIVRSPITREVGAAVLQEAIQRSGQIQTPDRTYLPSVVGVGTGLVTRGLLRGVEAAASKLPFRLPGVVGGLGRVGWEIARGGAEAAGFGAGFAGAVYAEQKGLREVIRHPGEALREAKYGAMGALPAGIAIGTGFQVMRGLARGGIKAWQWYQRYQRYQRRKEPLQHPALPTSPSVASEPRVSEAPTPTPTSPPTLPSPKEALSVMELSAWRVMLRRHIPMQAEHAERLANQITAQATRRWQSLQQIDEHTNIVPFRSREGFTSWLRNFVDELLKEEEGLKSQLKELREVLSQQQPQGWEGEFAKNFVESPEVGLFGIVYGKRPQYIAQTVRAYSPGEAKVVTQKISLQKEMNEKINLLSLREVAGKEWFQRALTQATDRILAAVKVPEDFRPEFVSEILSDPLKLGVFWGKYVPLMAERNEGVRWVVRDFYTLLASGMWLQENPRWHGVRIRSAVWEREKELPRESFAQATAIEELWREPEPQPRGRRRAQSTVKSSQPPEATPQPPTTSLQPPEATLQPPTTSLTEQPPSGKLSKRQQELFERLHERQMELGDWLKAVSAEPPELPEERNLARSVERPWGSPVEIRGRPENLSWEVIFFEPAKLTPEQIQSALQIPQGLLPTVQALWKQWKQWKQWQQGQQGLKAPFPTEILEQIGERLNKAMKAAALLLTEYGAMRNVKQLKIQWSFMPFETPLWDEQKGLALAYITSEGEGAYRIDLNLGGMMAYIHNWAQAYPEKIRSRTGPLAEIERTLVHELLHPPIAELLKHIAPETKQRLFADLLEGFKNTELFSILPKSYSDEGLAELLTLFAEHRLYPELVRRVRLRESKNILVRIYEYLWHLLVSAYEALRGWVSPQLRERFYYNVLRRYLQDPSAITSGIKADVPSSQLWLKAVPLAQWRQLSAQEIEDRLRPIRTLEVKPRLGVPMLADEEIRPLLAGDIALAVMSFDPEQRTIDIVFDKFGVGYRFTVPTDEAFQDIVAQALFPINPEMALRISEGEVKGKVPFSIIAPDVVLAPKNEEVFQRTWKALSALDDKTQELILRGWGALATTLSALQKALRGTQNKLKQQIETIEEQINALKEKGEAVPKQLKQLSAQLKDLKAQQAPLQKILETEDMKTLMQFGRVASSVIQPKPEYVDEPAAVRHRDLLSSVYDWLFAQPQPALERLEVLGEGDLGKEYQTIVLTKGKNLQRYLAEITVIPDIPSPSQVFLHLATATKEGLKNWISKERWTENSWAHLIPDYKKHQPPQQTLLSRLQNVQSSLDDILKVIAVDTTVHEKLNRLRGIIQEAINIVREHGKTAEGAKQYAEKMSEVWDIVTSLPVYVYHDTFAYAGKLWKPLLNLARRAYELGAQTSDVPVIPQLPEFGSHGNYRLLDFFMALQLPSLRNRLLQYARRMGIPQEQVGNWITTRLSSAGLVDIGFGRSEDSMTLQMDNLWKAARVIGKYNPEAIAEKLEDFPTPVGDYLDEGGAAVILRRFVEDPRVMGMKVPLKDDEIMQIHNNIQQVIDVLAAKGHWKVEAPGQAWRDVVTKVLNTAALNVDNDMPILRSKIELQGLRWLAEQLGMEIPKKGLKLSSFLDEVTQQLKANAPNPDAVSPQTVVDFLHAVDHWARRYLAEIVKPAVESVQERPEDIVKVLPFSALKEVMGEEGTARDIAEVMRMREMGEEEEVVGLMGLVGMGEEAEILSEEDILERTIASQQPIQRLLDVRESVLEEMFPDLMEQTRKFYQRLRGAKPQTLRAILQALDTVRAVSSPGAATSPETIGQALSQLARALTIATETDLPTLAEQLALPVGLINTGKDILRAMRNIVEGSSQLLTPEEYVRWMQEPKATLAQNISKFQDLWDTGLVMRYLKNGENLYETILDMIGPRHAEDIDTPVDKTAQDLVAQLMHWTRGEVPSDWQQYADALRIIIHRGVWDWLDEAQQEMVQMTWKDPLLRATIDQWYAKWMREQQWQPIGDVQKLQVARMTLMSDPIASNFVQNMLGELANIFQRLVRMETDLRRMQATNVRNGVQGALADINQAVQALQRQLQQQVLPLEVRRRLEGLLLDFRTLTYAWHKLLDNVKENVESDKIVGLVDAWNNQMGRLRGQLVALRQWLVQGDTSLFATPQPVREASDARVVLEVYKDVGDIADRLSQLDLSRIREMPPDQAAQHIVGVAQAALQMLQEINGRIAKEENSGKLLPGDRALLLQNVLGKFLPVFNDLIALLDQLGLSGGAVREQLMRRFIDDLLTPLNDLQKLPPTDVSWAKMVLLPDELHEPLLPGWLQVIDNVVNKLTQWFHLSPIGKALGNIYGIAGAGYGPIGKLIGVIIRNQPNLASLISADWMKIFLEVRQATNPQITKLAETWKLSEIEVQQDIALSLQGYNPNHPRYYERLAELVDGIVQLREIVTEFRQLLQDKTRRAQAEKASPYTRFILNDGLLQMLDILQAAFVGSVARMDQNSEYAEAVWRLAQHYRAVLNKIYQEASIHPLGGKDGKLPMYLQDYYPWVPHELGSWFIEILHDMWDMMEAVQKEVPEDFNELRNIYRQWIREGRVRGYEASLQYQRYLPHWLVALTTSPILDDVITYYIQAVANAAAEGHQFYRLYGMIQDKEELKQLLPNFYKLYDEMRQKDGYPLNSDSWAAILQDTAAFLKERLSDEEFNKRMQVLAKAVRFYQGSVDLRNQWINPAAEKMLDGLMQEIQRFHRANAETFARLWAEQLEPRIRGGIPHTRIGAEMGRFMGRQLSELLFGRGWRWWKAWSVVEAFSPKTSILNLLEGFAGSLMIPGATPAKLAQWLATWLTKAITTPPKLLGDVEFWKMYVGGMVPLKKAGVPSAQLMDKFLNDPVYAGILNRFMVHWMALLRRLHLDERVANAYTRQIGFDLSEMMVLLRTAATVDSFYQKTGIWDLMKKVARGESLTHLEEWKLDEVGEVLNIGGFEQMKALIQDLWQLAGGDEVAFDTKLRQEILGRAVMEVHHVYAAWDMPWLAQNPWVSDAVYFLRRYSFQHGHKLAYHLFTRPWEQLVKAYKTGNPEIIRRAWVNLLTNSVLGFVAAGAWGIGTTYALRKYIYAPFAMRHEEEPESFREWLKYTYLPPGPFGWLSDIPYDIIQNVRDIGRGGLDVVPLPLALPTRQIFNLLGAVYTGAKLMINRDMAAYEKFWNFISQFVPAGGMYLRPLLLRYAGASRTPKADINRVLYPATPKLGISYNVSPSRVVDGILSIWAAGKIDEAFYKLFLPLRPDDFVAVFARGIEVSPEEARNIMLKAVKGWAREFGASSQAIEAWHRLIEDAYQAWKQTGRKQVSMQSLQAQMYEILMKHAAKLPPDTRLQLLEHITLGLAIYPFRPAHDALFKPYRTPQELRKDPYIRGDPAAPHVVSRLVPLKGIAQSYAYYSFRQAVAEEIGVSPDDPRLDEFMRLYLDPKKRSPDLLTEVFQVPATKLKAPTWQRIFAKAISRTFYHMLPIVWQMHPELLPTESVQQQLRELDRLKTQKYVQYYQRWAAPGVDPNLVIMLAHRKVVEDPEIQALEKTLVEEVVKESLRYRQQLPIAWQGKELTPGHLIWVFADERVQDLFKSARQRMVTEQRTEQMTDLIGVGY